MIGYIGRRILLSMVTLWVLSMFSFAVIQLPPGDFVDAYIANQVFYGSVVSDAEAQSMRADYGLDRPIYVQYIRWMGKILRGDFGMSIQWRQPVIDVIADRLLLTVAVSGAAVLLTWALALPIGIYSAVKQYSLGDYVFTLFGFLGLAIPNFLLALTLMYLGFTLFDASIGGLFSPEFVEAPWTLARVWDLAKHLPIPAIVLTAAGAAETIRVMRANLLDELYKPYVVTARAKGLSEIRLILKYPVRLALNPFISTIGFALPYIVSGSIIISVVLGLPTVGPVLLQALVAQDVLLAGSIVLLLGVMTVVGMLISDFLLAWVDPRIRLEEI